jgi:hypothetical protein
VQFVEACDKSCAQNSDGCPAQRPLHIAHRGQGGAPRAKKQHAEDAIADDVACLANVEVPNIEALPVEAEEEMQQGIQNAAGVVRREQRTGFNGDKDEPQDRGDPGLQNVVAIGVQEDWALSVPRFAKNAKGGEPTTSLDRRALLDAIVGSLAGDHYVVDVALAQSGAADAHEAGFLQEFGNSRAAAIAHA